MAAALGCTCTACVFCLGCALWLGLEGCAPCCVGRSLSQARTRAGGASHYIIEHLVVTVMGASTSRIMCLCLGSSRILYAGVGGLGSRSSELAFIGFYLGFVRACVLVWAGRLAAYGLR